MPKNAVRIIISSIFACTNDDKKHTHSTALPHKKFSYDMNSDKHTCKKKNKKSATTVKKTDYYFNLKCCAFILKKTPKNNPKRSLFSMHIVLFTSVHDF